MSELMKIDKNYSLWIQDISSRFKKSQIKAATYVNSEMLLFYWGIGADIVERKMLSGYGSNFYNNLSSDLKEVLPEVKSFSPRNLRYMADFYEMYKDMENLQQLVAKCEKENLQQLVADSEVGIIFKIPWGHHIQILTKCKDNRDKALYFVRQSVSIGI